MSTETGLHIDHIALPVTDVPATLHFYRDVLQLPLVRAFSGDDWGGHPWLMMIFALGDGRQLALSALRGVPVPTEETLPPDLRHVGIAVASEDELEVWRQRLQDHAIPHWAEDHGEQTSLYFTDPSNIILEITTPPSRELATPDPHAAAVVDAWIQQAPRAPR